MLIIHSDVLSLPKNNHMENCLAYPRLRTKINGKKYNPNSDPIGTMNLILASDYGITLDDICVKCRSRSVKYIRQSVQVILSRNTHLCLTQIGVVTRRTHATVINSIRCIESDEFVLHRQGVSSQLLDIYNKLEQKYVKSYSKAK